MEDVFFWTRHGKFGFFSNFARTPVLIDNEIWPTVEHYFQAQKSFDYKYQAKILACEKPFGAKRKGYTAKLRPGWDEGIKEEVMLKGLRAKFKQYPALRKILLSTGDAAIHEDSPTDMYWGYVKGKGKDRLGKLLMQVREELRQ